MGILLATTLLIMYRGENQIIAIEGQRLAINSRAFNLQSSERANFLSLEDDKETLVAKITCDSYWHGDQKKDRFRSEFQSTHKEQFETLTEYSFSFKIDSTSDKQALKRGVVIAQFHSTEDFGDFSGYPVLEFVVNNLGIEVYSSSNKERITPKHYPRTKLLEPYNVDYRSYVEVQIAAKFSYRGRGKLKIKINGNLVVDLDQINMGSNDEVGPYFKFGVYTPKYECNKGFQVKFRRIKWA